MNCFAGEFGIRGCNSSPSKLYLDQIPGLSIMRLDKATNQGETLKEALDGLEKLAWNQFLSDVAKHLEPRFLFQSVTATGLRARPVPNTWLTAQGIWRGIRFQCFEGVYHALRINRVFIRAQAAQANVQLRVFDLNSGLVEWAHTVNLEAGMNEIEIGEEFTTRYDRLDMFLAYDATAAIVQQVRIVDTRDDDCGCLYSVCNSCDDCDSACNVYFAQTDSLSLDVLASQLERTAEGSGIFAEYEYGCSLASLVCRQKSLFQRPWQNILTQMSLYKLLNHERFNSLALDRKQLAQTFEDYQKQYTTNLDSAIKRLNAQCGPCFRDNRMVRNINLLP